MSIQAPFPWFGGKRRVAPEVWARFGDVPNYVEPFFGSGAAVLPSGRGCGMTVCAHRTEPTWFFTPCKPCVCGEEVREEAKDEEGEE